MPASAPDRKLRTPPPPVLKPAVPEPAADPGGRFFRPLDWAAFWLAFLVSFLVYAFSLAPTVTLEDSGELVVASDYLGVPHPPGYPLWTILTWFFQLVFHFVRYQGHPNPAWAVNLFSAFCGSFTSGLVALLASRSGFAMLRQIFPALRSGILAWLGFAAAVSASLILGFNQLMWSQAVIAEVYTLNTLLHLIIFVFVYVWLHRPQDNRLLFLTAFFYGLAFTNCQPIMLITFGLLLALGLARPALCRDSLCLASPVAMIWLVLKFQDLNDVFEKNGEAFLAHWAFFIGVTAALMLLIAALVMLARSDLTRRLGPKLTLVLVFLGVSLIVALASFPGLKKYATEPQFFRVSWELFLWTLCVAGMVFFTVRLLIRTGAVFTEWRDLVIMAICAGLGLSMFFYMPISSDHNPPMNWGYTRTLEGFKHAVTRGQYQKLDPAIEPSAFFRQAGMYLVDMNKRFNPLILLAGLAAFAAIPFIDRRHRGWFGVLGLSFFFLSFVFIALLNPGHDVQALFIGRVQFVQADAVFALWLGYGLALIAAVLIWLAARGRPRGPVDAGPDPVYPLTSGLAAVLGAVLLLAPVGMIWKNAKGDKAPDAWFGAFGAAAAPDQAVVDYGDARLHGHDFGWQFGSWQLEGLPAILRDLRPGETLPPTTDYPPPMTTNAVFYGGTDPGRFVPTYMIYSADCRSDVLLITQNALADNTYMNVMRDLYGDLIWMPTAQDCNLAFQQYVRDVKEGRIPQNASITIDPNGRVSVQGVQGVMEINGIIARMIFEANKHLHDFYVEESYVIQWMYPYLEPHGLILKINKEPLPSLPPETVRNDTAFWDWYTAKLLADPKFDRDMVARKTFSKLRCAIAGVYAFRRMFPEAEHAFKQALELYPLSPEANFRLAELYMQFGRFDQAYTLLDTYRKGDPLNDKIEPLMNNIRMVAQMNQRMAELQTALQENRATPEMAIELASLYLRGGREAPFREICRMIVENNDVPPQAYLEVARLYASLQPPPLPELIRAFTRYLERQPGDPHAWLNLASLHAAANDTGRALQALRQAVSIGGQPLREAARTDPRLKPLHGLKEYQQLVAPPNQPFMF
jgi:tetratricopeptide (TPR) repeat protein